METTGWHGGQQKVHREVPAAGVIDKSTERPQLVSLDAGEKKKLFIKVRG